MSDVVVVCGGAGVVVGTSSSGIVGLSALTIEGALDPAEWKDVSSFSLNLEVRGDRCWRLLTFSASIRF